MEKGLIGNSLSYTMQEILSGKISAEDIDKIYAQTCVTKNTMSKIITEYNFYWENAARTRAKTEICQKYGVEDIWDLEDEEKRHNAHEELYARTGELIPQVVTEAETLLHKLWDEGKIIQTRYRVPEGQTVKAKVFPSYEFYHGGQVSDEVEVTGKGQGRYDEILDLNGEYYYCSDTAIASLGLQRSGLFNDEKELIANQLFVGYSWQDSQRNADRLFAFQKMFPQYKDAIAQVGGKLNTDSIRNLTEQSVLEMLQEALKEREKHTAEEIREGIEGLTQGEVGEALKTITEGEALKTITEGELDQPKSPTY